ncbi:constitutive coactivator of peroxisome proliferator-activated receptor gamma-like [Homalodisca vitripennis]|uniref:constitutive coactivator of peroxisome proliferator-activated receptor gamma-like n=1 Tax=Homalodisca vitripennis TaxID=197043 RepID=UPI001EEC03FF|nr:constitutive coactivator of peroxisome proliferator-activated receptor gamma-like [Homalodisca vitripennis]
MGVRGLESYMETSCRASVPLVNIADRAIELRRTSLKPDQELIIVVDGSCCLRILYGDLEWVGGAQLQQYKEKAKHFVQAFKDLNMRLVFFFDGPILERKRKTWVKKRLSKLKPMYQVLDAINKNKPTHNIPKHCFELPPGVAQLARVTFKIDCGCQVYQTLKECDEEITEYARKNRAFGILAQDTDYVIMDTGDTLYLSMKHLNLGNMTTRVYDRWNLARSLNLDPSQLPLLATLMGNDIINVEHLKRFHLQLNREGNLGLVQNIAEYVRTLPRDEAQLKQMLPDISKKTLGHPFKKSDIVCSLNSYKLCATDTHPTGQLHGGSGQRFADRSTPGFSQRQQRGLQPFPQHKVSRRRRRGGRFPIHPRTFQAYLGYERGEISRHDNWTRVMVEARNKHQIDKLPNMVYAVMSGLPFESSTSLEDFRQDDLPTFASVTQLIRQQTYGILLQEKPPPESGVHMVPEWCMAGPRSLDQANYVAAIPPASPHPGLFALWNGEDERLVSVRWRLFVSSVSRNLNISRVRYLPSHLVIPTLILFKLNELDCLYEWEVNAMLATASCIRHYDVAMLKALPSDPVTARGVRVSNLIMRFTFVLYFLLAACGYPLTERETDPSLFFDGKLFQVKYNKSKAGCSIEELCDNEPDLLEDFIMAYDVVFQNH